MEESARELGGESLAVPRHKGNAGRAQTELNDPQRPAYRPHAPARDGVSVSPEVQLEGQREVQLDRTKKVQKRTNKESVSRQRYN